MREQGDFMNTRAPHSLTLTLVLGGACLAGLGCSTTTPIGSVDEATAGANGTMAGSQGATAAAGAQGLAGQGAPGAYVPSGEQVLNDPPLTNPSGVSGDWVGYLENYD